ncbi:MAG TPA: hypothetical protein VMV10_24835 [Pirellulales bacterium]|nr:hypothetical protein [Pirellulales bacterium]
MSFLVGEEALIDFGQAAIWRAGFRRLDARGAALLGVGGSQQYDRRQ